MADEQKPDQKKLDLLQHREDTLFSPWISFMQKFLRDFFTNYHHRVFTPQFLPFSMTR
jgi:hypothetical protein